MHSVGGVIATVATNKRQWVYTEIEKVTRPCENISRLSIGKFSQ